MQKYSLNITYNLFSYKKRISHIHSNLITSFRTVQYTKRRNHRSSWDTLLKEVPGDAGSHRQQALDFVFTFGAPLRTKQRKSGLVVAW